MILTVKTTQHLKGKVALPPSKSYSIRAALIASCGGSSVIYNYSNCDDAVVAMKVAEQFGAHIVKGWHGEYRVTASKKKPCLSKVDVNESGTVLRIILPMIALQYQNAQVVGKGTLKGRPNLFLTQTLRKMGVRIRGYGDKESIPIRISQSHMKPGEIVIDGSLSSQFISALLIACPQMAEESRLVLTGKRLVSMDYITMTMQVLQQSGVFIQKKSEREYRIKGGQEFKGLSSFRVPSDYGLAAFLLAAGTLVKSNLILTGVFNDKFIQADGHILSFLKDMGVRFQKDDRAIKMKGPFSLKGGTFSLKVCPDLVPIMAVLALFAKGRTRLVDIQHARAKESDRITDLRKELLKVGANVKEKANELIIDPLEDYESDVVLDPHKDHRLAMSFCVLGLKLGTRVKNMECAGKSYPEFVCDFKAIGAEVDQG